MPISLFILEDHTLFRELLIERLKNSLKVKVVGSFGNGPELLNQLDALTGANVGILDVRLGAINSFDLIPELRKRLPDTRLMWVTSILEDAILHRALGAQLHGFVHKEDPAEDLVAAVQRVASGGTYMSDSVRKMKEALHKQPNLFSRILSAREQEVLKIIARGYSNEEASDILGLSHQTVKTHRRNIMGRLNLHSAAELLAYAIQNGFIEASSLRTKSGRSAH